MRLETYMLAIAVVLTGLMAGIFFTWSNAVKPGIGKLSDIEYLSAFQSMNRVILNPSFKALFIAAIIATIILPFLYRNQFPNTLFWLLCTSFLFYWIGALQTIGLNCKDQAFLHIHPVGRFAGQIILTIDPERTSLKYLSAKTDLVRARSLKQKMHLHLLMQKYEEYWTNPLLFRFY